MIWIGLIDSGVSEKILRCVRVQPLLDIQKQPVIGLLAGGVADSAQVEVLADVPILRHKVPGHTSNLHTKINPAAFHGIVKICESVTRIARSVASNDQIALAAQQSPHCQVLEV